MKFKRIFLIVMDSLGVGHAEDAHKFNDEGSNTFYHVNEAMKYLNIPNLEKLGVGYLDDYNGINKPKDFKGYIGRLKERSNGKDTMTGHWEMMGLYIEKPFKTFTDTGFPKELLDEFTRRTGKEIIGNISASGTKIIEDLGEEHMKTGKLIIYTSADSVLQIAANEATCPIDELYKYCEIARDITMKDEWKVGRIIARPFIGTSKDNFKRTARRHDYALSPFDKTYMNVLKDKGYDVVAVGKINDIFNTEGVTEAIKTVSNVDGMEKTIEIAKNKDFNGLCFVNLVDFVMEYGHRRDPIGYGKCIEEFDSYLGKLMGELNNDDLIILTADHGNDPTMPGSDHTREEVPLILYSKAFKQGKLLEKGDTFGNIGASIINNFNIEKPKNLLGKSIL